MAVIIKLNGIYIGETTKTPIEIRSAESAGFTVLRKRKENKQMSREAYNYKRTAIATAKDLFYPQSVILRLQTATTESEIARIMKTARERMED